MATANISEWDAPDGLDALRRDRKRFVAFAFCAADILVETDAQGCITFAAGATRAVTGVEPDRLIGERLITLVAPEDRTYVAELMGGMIALGRFDAVMAHLVGPDGITPPLRLSGRHLADMPGRFFFALKMGAAVIDPEIAGSPTRDSVSGLLDGESSLPIAGHQTKLLTRAGEDLRFTLFHTENLPRLREQLGSEQNQRQAATISAYLHGGAAGGDGAGQLDETNYGLRHRRQLDIQGLRAKIETWAREVDAEGAGVTVHSDSIETNSPAMSDTGAQRVAALHQIIQSGNFDVVFQPIVEVAMKRIHHFEALARFPTLGDADESPYSTIVLAETTGLITDFDLAMCRRVIEWMATHSPERDTPIIAVNVSGGSVNDLAFRDSLLELLAAHPNERKRVIFEITESAHIPDLAAAKQFIDSLRSAGHKVCLDDFGAGSAALVYLGRLQVDIVKIDGKFLHSAVTDSKSKVLLKTKAALCHDLGIEMIAEKVEDKRYLSLLEECGIRYAQGYHYGRPHADLNSFVRPEQPKQVNVKATGLMLGRVGHSLGG